MFTVSVGNLPPGAQVLIKITYVAELLMEREHICFSLPGSVAPWKRNKALEEITQVIRLRHTPILPGREVFKNVLYTRGGSAPRPSLLVTLIYTI